MLFSAFCVNAEDRVIKTVKGYVSDVDYAGSTVVLAVTRAGSVDEESKEISFKVDEDAKITRGTDTIGLAEINVNDFVTVEYYADDSGDYHASRLIDNNLAEL